MNDHNKKNKYKIGDIVRDTANGKEAIVVVEMDKTYGYLIGYLDTPMNRHPFQYVTDKEIQYIDEPSVADLEQLFVFKNELIKTEFTKYKDEYKDKGQLIANLRYYGLM